MENLKQNEMRQVMLHVLCTVTSMCVINAFFQHLVCIIYLL